MSDELKPGFASQEPVQAEIVSDVPVSGLLARAHYAGLQPEEASATWEREHLCTKCLHAQVCKYAADTDEALVVISRCLGFLPAG